MPKIGFSWKSIHQEILNEFCPDFRELDANAFMKLIFPEDIFNSLFIQNDIYREDLVCAAYHGQPEAEPVYRMMAEKLSATSERGRSYTYDNNPRIQAFQCRWEVLLPFTKMTAGAPNMEEEKSRWQMKLCINDLVCEIPEELTNINIPLSLLIDQQKYSVLLAILSVMATALSQMENNDSHLYKNVFPVVDKDGASFDLLCRSETKITWEMLHNQVFKRLRKDGCLDNLNDFLPAFLPGKLLHELCATKDKPGKPGHVTQKNTGYVYLAKKGAAPRFQAARNYITNQTSETGEPYTWDTSPIISHIKEKWEEWIPETKHTAPECESTEDAAVKEMQAVVDCLLDAIPPDRQNVAARIQAITGNKSYSMVLALLSVIACTLFCFAMEGEEPAQEDRILYDVVLPPLPSMDASSTLQRARQMYNDPGISLEDLEITLDPICPRNRERNQDLDREKRIEQGEGYYLLYEKAEQEKREAKAEDYLRDSSNAGYLPALQKSNEIKTRKLLKEAQMIFNGPNGINYNCFDRRCCDKCETILRMPTYISRECRAEAAYILYKCISADKYHPTTGETAEYYLEMSHMYGYAEATEEWKNRNTSTIVPEPSRSGCRTEGICHCNAVNEYTAALEKTIPDSWGGALVPFDLAELAKEVFNPTPRRLLFLSDDFAQNLSDLFQTLQLVKKYAPEPETLHWEFFVRHDSESIHALVDTALSRLTAYTIPVYIINDSKAAAQQLLSQHPLFYPVRALKLDKIEKTGDQRPLLHFVVIGNSPVTEWLVREAFWMMGFRKNAIRSRITVLDENGKSFEVSLKGRFPGMRGDITKIDGIELPEIRGENVALESAGLQTKIQEYTGETDYCYFAVATDSDEGNLTLAIHVREALIRSAIESQEQERLNEMPPVAFLCRSGEIAWLSKCMVVEKEEYGNSWFNTRALIPFGEVSSRYHFDNIAGGTFDLLAKCIHYQYSQLDPAMVLSGSPEALAAEKNYYLRQYNQDSSYSMALGMPYRLFQFKDSNGIQITPTGWNILQSSSFASVNQLHFMAERMKTSEDAEIRTISEWEHARWVRWMLSRGWKAASIEEAVFAHHSGNPRQQLFACKMHPLICAYDEQKNLAEKLKENCGINKDFYSYDYRNVEATRQLLDLEWVVDKTREAASKPRASER